ncbi:similar to Saccharomyces cerevisiae YBR110W ALG1 Mannosyltransferase, involved in asparagine- linked glycosylation in the endoplasmic reticulum (ER) [Maudiozyma barnettii]|uniref:Chitobiosyldiphosphodolichol beta-mannosyltransferase n=1 Tax=Maudiozyma barnettii TaxID=61262 RepID=A0A8H2VAY7_9SACH|nr:chitobiosyldiphosphodolichol beta-1,4 mannosyltransferase [Kazachstania barnettii]CAB4251931.1 similar to Saccharomyces cerevisiae YBR110W ALG1 Mannosyltransferase, involved in asparagine- linked glycosylation in the endoplasmic reticulum (ER) [Kazachstania barnettii]CAD1778283.1 similar to Saccharomyces cerevisiae YBR110W ALG1 Mannosyltransferase, involved in asparagine- linked glycosylation in the endoplasmic reticulum (ER) [Kazachstania barnettii]
MALFSIPDTLSPWLVTLILVYMSLPIVIYYAIPFLFYGNRSTKKRIIIYVLGDIGHSPRMCYHAQSFAMKGFQVEFCGYVDSQLPNFITKNHNITIHPIPRINQFGMVHKVIFQILVIVSKLWELRGSDYLLVQNPPSIPLFPIITFYRLIGCKIIIDWHNLAYSILKLKLKCSSWHPLVIVAIFVELFFGRFANYHLTVTDAMKAFLINSFKFNDKKIVVLHDRPPVQFVPFKETPELTRDMALHTEPFIKDLIPEGFDITKGDKIIVTSTSFTPDEDIGILLGALKIYESSYEKFDNNLPKILCFITGKGPLREQYMKQVAETKWNVCHVEFVWLSSEDYPKLLRLCDYGVSLHTSSSGLDLPMKILDMFGSGLPVIAMNYPVLDELVTHGQNGLKFTDRRELHESLIFAMKDPEIYQTLRKGAIEESKNRWDSTWEKSMKEINLIH